MPADYKEKLLLTVKTRLVNAGYSLEDINTITNMMIIELDEYELTPVCRDIVPYDTASDTLIQVYSAVLATSGLAPGTIANYTNAIRNFRRALGKSLTEATTMDIRVWLAIDQTHVCLRTSDGHRTALLCFYNWLVSEGIVPANPCQPIKPIKYPVVLQLPFTEIEVDLLRSHCKTLRERAELEVLLSSGVRVSELCNLDRKDVDFTDNRVHIRKGKGAKDRLVYISDVAAMHLKKYLTSRTDHAECLFYTKFRTRLADKVCQDDLKKIGKRAGVADVHPQRCRHTFATMSYKRGMDIRVIQMLMGHANINQTMEYILTDDSYMRDEFKKHSYGN